MAKIINNLTLASMMLMYSFKGKGPAAPDLPIVARGSQMLYLYVSSMRVCWGAIIRISMCRGHFAKSIRLAIVEYLIMWQGALHLVRHDRPVIYRAFYSFFFYFDGTGYMGPNICSKTE